MENEDMNRCPQCGELLLTSSKYCNKCGIKIESGQNSFYSGSSVMNNSRDEIDILKRELMGELDLGSSLSSDYNIKEKISIDSINLQSIQNGHNEDYFDDKFWTHNKRPGHITDYEFNLFFSADPARINQLFQFVISNPYITNNEHYSGLINNIKFGYDDKSETINAFAGRDENGDPVIVLHGGLIRANCLLGSALAALLELNKKQDFTRSYIKNDNRSYLKGLIENIVSNPLNEENSQNIFEKIIMARFGDEVKEILNRAQSYSATMTMYVIAHEIGHIVYGHSGSPMPNLDISKNREREADSFASSIMSNSPFREYLVIGQIFSNLLFTWVDSVTNNGNEATTHPLSRERFSNAIDSNESGIYEIEKYIGLTKTDLEDLLPS